MKPELQKHNVVYTRVFEAPIEEVWKAWIEPEKVKMWWGPTGFTCTLAEMDFREGGTSLVCMRAPVEFGGQDFYNTWTYQNIKPYESFEYILKFTDKDGKPHDPQEMGIPPGVPKEVLNTNQFKDLGNGKTEITIKEFGYATEEAAELSKQGLDQCMDKMAAIFVKP